MKEQENSIIKMRLYGFYGLFKKVYFERMEELEYWLKYNNTSLGVKCMFDYLEEFAGEKNVIRITTENGKISYYTKDATYNKEKQIWEKPSLNIDDIYDAFKEHDLSTKEKQYCLK